MCVRVSVGMSEIASSFHVKVRDFPRTFVAAGAVGSVIIGAGSPVRRPPVRVRLSTMSHFSRAHACGPARSAGKA